MGIVKACMVRDQISRDAEYKKRLIDRSEERERRQEEGRIREQERADERERRAEERERSKRMGNMPMITLLGKGSSDLIVQNTKRKDSLCEYGSRCARYGLPERSSEAYMNEGFD